MNILTSNNKSDLYTLFLNGSQCWERGQRSVLKSHRFCKNIDFQVDVICQVRQIVTSVSMEIVELYLLIISRKASYTVSHETRDLNWIEVNEVSSKESYKAGSRAVLDVAHRVRRHHPTSNYRPIIRERVAAAFRTCNVVFRLAIWLTFKGVILSDPISLWPWGWSFRQSTALSHTSTYPWYARYDIKVPIMLNDTDLEHYRGCQPIDSCVYDMQYKVSIHFRIPPTRELYIK